MRSTRALDKTVSAVVEQLEHRLMLTAVSWDGGGDGINWTDPNNWSNNVLPGATDDVTISVASNPTVRISVGSQSINSLASDEALALDGGTLSIAAASRINSSFGMSGGTLSGSGDLTLTGASTWGYAIQTGTGKITIAPGAVVTLNSTSNFGANLHKSIDVGGTVNWTSGTYGFDHPFNILSGGVLNLSPTSGYFASEGVGAAINSAGTVNKTGPNATAIVYIPFNNSGTVNIQAGVLQLQGGGSNAGTIQVDAPGTLLFSGGYTHTVGSTLSGPGAFNFSGGNHTFAGQFLPTGAVYFSAGIITINNTITPATLGPINNSTVIFNAPQSFVSLNISGGTLSGSGDVTLTGASTWGYGAINGTGKITIVPGAVLNLNSTSNFGTLVQKSIDVGGRLAWAGGTFGFDRPINVLADGRFDASPSGGYLYGAGPVTIATGATFTKSGGSIAPMNIPFNNAGTVNVLGGTLQLNDGGTHTGSVSVEGSLYAPSLNPVDPARIATGAVGSIYVLGDLVGNTRNADLYEPKGRITFNGGGSRRLEVMGADRGATSLGFQDNFAYGQISIQNNTSLTLVDQFDNAAGATAEVLYVGSLSVASGSTLNLNGFKVYARATQISGTITGGTIVFVDDSGPLELGTPVTGRISAVGEADEWTFFGRAGRGVTVLLNPGPSDTSSSIGALPPPINFAQVDLIDPLGNTIASLNNSTGIAGSMVNLLGVQLTSEGVYRIVVKAPMLQSSSIGRYVLTAWDATVDVATLALGQQRSGVIETPYSVDRWTFSANANDQISFDWINSASSGIVFTLNGPNGFTAFTDVFGDAGPLNLPTAGQYTLTARSVLGASGAYSFKIVQTSQFNLSLGTNLNGSLAGSGQTQLFKFVVPTSKTLSLMLEDLNNSDRNEIYLRLGTPPTRADYDYTSDGQNSADRNILIPKAAAGTWYALIYGDYVPSPTSYSLRADAADAVLTHATPDRYGATTGAVMTLTGAGFIPGTIVQLFSGATSYTATSSTVDSFTQITANFDLTRVPVGLYSIRITSPLGNPNVLPNAFTVTSVGKSKFETHLILPSALGRHQLATIYVEYENTGNAAMPAPLVQVRSADSDDSDKPLLTLNDQRLHDGFWTSALPAGFDHSVSILASGAQPGVLQPGEKMRVPIYYAGLQQPWDFSDDGVELGLSIIDVNDPRAMNWQGTTYSIIRRAYYPGTLADGPSYLTFARYSGWVDGVPPSDLQLHRDLQLSSNEELLHRYDEPGVLQLRPDGYNPEAWQVVVYNLMSQVGGSLGNWVRALDDNATYLGRQGITTNDIGALWGFEVLQASDALSPVQTLGATTDAAMPAPGLSLFLSRSFSNTIAGRYSDGPFGKGWTMGWDLKLAEEPAPSGAVIIGNSAGSSRRYEPDSRVAGKYFSQPGDSSTLKKINGVVFELRDSNGAVTRFRTSDGRIDYVQDTNANRITASYNAQGQFRGLVHSSGASLTVAYNAVGRIKSITDSAGRVTTFGYDSTNTYLLSATDDDGKVTRYGYETAGSVRQRHALHSIESRGVTQFFNYDFQGRLDTTYKTGQQELIDFNYDSAGTVSINNGFGITNLYYDQQGRLVKTQDPLGNITQSQFDPNGRLARIISPTGDAQNFTWDASGGLTSLADELGNKTAFRYDNAYHELTSFTDAKLNTTRYAYDANGNLLGTTYADNSVESFSNQSAAGLPQTSTNRRGQAINYQYNAAGQVIHQTFADTSHDDFIYDGRGNLKTVMEVPATGASKLTTYDYDYAASGDRLKKVNHPQGRWVEYFFDEFGRHQRMTDSAGGDTRYEYDTAGRLWKLRDATNAVLVEYLYDPAGRLLRINKGNGTYTTYGYDAAGQILHLFNYAPGGGVNSRFDYTYDSRGRRTSMGTIDGDWTYEYDATGQLIYAQLASTNPQIPSQDLRYVYDALGNRIRTILNGATTEYTTNNLNQYTSLGGLGYRYDADGNLTFDGVNTYTYDQQNHLVSVIGPSGVTQYEYDASGNRTASIINGQRTEYLNNPTGLVDVTAEYDGVGNFRARNVHGLGLVGRTEGNGSVSYFDFDALGSAADMTGDTGSTVNTYAYEPFGTTLLSNVSLSNPFQFVGQLGVQSSGTGLSFMRARYYLASAARFTSPDPLRLLGGDTSFYRYAANSPVSSIDPVGRSVGAPEAVGLGLGLIGSGLEIKMSFLRAQHKAGVKLLGRVGTAFYFPGVALDIYQYENDRSLGNAVPLALDVAQGVIMLTLTAVPASYWGALVGAFQLGLGVGSWLHDSFIDPINRYLFYAIRFPGLPVEFSDSVTTVTALDPNGKSANTGYGPRAFIAPGTPIPYTIHFENYGPGTIEPNGQPAPAERWATAPAQSVTITDQLSADLDWTTFGLTGLGFGDTVVTIPAYAQHYQGTFSLTYNGHMFNAELEAGIDLSTGRVYATFQSLDPLTSLPPDVLTGFLPPEDGSGRGKGYFTYVVSAKSNLTTGIQIRNVALISFDGQTFIATNQIDPLNPAAGTDPNREARNVIDSGKPVSSVAAMPPNSPGEFLVTWAGQDDAGGSGVYGYDVYVSDNGAPGTLWLTNTTEANGVYAGQQGHTYSFYSIARDNVGNIEAAPPTPDATTFVADGIAPTVISAEFEGRTPVAVQGRYLTVQLSENVRPVLTDLRVRNDTVGQDVIPTQVTFNTQSNTLILTFGTLADGNYTFTLPSYAIVDIAGNLLDGNKDGSAGGDFTFSFFTLLGDVNRDRTVNQLDRDLVSAAFGTAGVRPQDGDANGDGYVDFLDLARLAQHYNVSTGNTLLDGDFNGDGAVDFLDLAIMAQSYNRGGRADVNGDGIVNQTDLDILNTNFGKTLPTPSTAARILPAPVSAVPSAALTFAEAWATLTGASTSIVTPMPPTPIGPTAVTKPLIKPTPKPVPKPVPQPAKALIPAKKPVVAVEKKTALPVVIKKMISSVTPPVFSMTKIASARKRSEVLI
jgi:RHS repeat-associated protein